MVKKPISGTPATVQSPRHVLIASALFSSSLLLGSLMLSVKAHADESVHVGNPSSNTVQSMSDAKTAESVSSAGVPENHANAMVGNTSVQSPVKDSATPQTVSANSEVTATAIDETGGTRSANNQSTNDAAHIESTVGSESGLKQTGSKQTDTQPDNPQVDSQQVVNQQTTIKQTAIEQPKPNNQQITSGTETNQPLQQSSQTQIESRSNAVQARTGVLPAAATVAPAPLGPNIIQNVAYNVPIPTNGTNAVSATNMFLTDYNSRPPWVNIHRRMNQVGNKNWISSAYSASISDTANGIDPATGNYYLDEWLPDFGLQYLIYYTNFTSQYTSFPEFREQFNKAALSTMTSLVTAPELQEINSAHVASSYYYQLMYYLETLEGLQYATSLENLVLKDNPSVTLVTWGTNINIRGNLWDISALANLPKLTNVEIDHQVVTDVSALKSVPNLRHIQFQNNSLSDISGLNINGIPLDSGQLSAQWMKVAPLWLPVGTTSVQLNFNVYGADGQLLAVKPYDANKLPNDIRYKQVASTAKGENVGPNTVVFSNILSPPLGRTGLFTIYFGDEGTFSDPNSSSASFSGVIIVPYIVTDEVGGFYTKYQYLQSDGQQVKIGPDSTLYGTIGEYYNLYSSALTNYPLSYLIDKLGSDYILLDGTGNYIDYLSQNGLANLVQITDGLMLALWQNLTVLWAGTTEGTATSVFWNGSSYVPIANSVTITNDIKSTAPISGLIQTIPNFTYSRAEIVDANGVSTPVNIATVPYLLSGSHLQLIYEPSSETATIPVNYVDSNGHPIAADGSLTGVFNTPIPASDLAAVKIPIADYHFDHFEKMDGTLVSDNITYAEVAGGLRAVYRSNRVTLSVKYMDQLGNPIAPDSTLSGHYADSVTANVFATAAIPIRGYTFRQVQKIDGTALTLPTTFENLPETLVFVYSRSFPLPGDPYQIGFPSTPTNPNSNQPPAMLNKVIYALDSINLYSGPNVETSSVLTNYLKKPRIYRPRFLVIGWAMDSQNRLRYQVRDINEKSATFGLVGYVTSDPKLVRGAYYQTSPAFITVLNPKGINGYRNVNLTGKTAHYKQGTVLKITRIVTGRTATRFILADGSYITANKTLVKTGIIDMPTAATKIKALNRYSNVQLTQRNHHYKTVAPQTFKIKGWDYSDGYNYHMKSLKRYLVSGGYISASPVLVKTKY